MGVLIAAIALLLSFWTTFFDDKDEAGGRSAQQGTYSSAPSDPTEDPADPVADSGTTPPPPREPASATPEPDPPAVTEPPDDDSPPRSALPTDDADAAGGSSRSGPLQVTIDMGDRGRVGPSQYRRGATPGANTEVYDEAGRVDTGCYVQWTLTRGTSVVQTHRSGRCRPPSITLFNFGDSLDEVGSYRLTADVTTDWGKEATASVDFDVVAGG
ncbi:hypothetical protein PV390_19690 [Streptomyces sp. ME02-6991-2A]|uniref:hypothetical protein n=1 Tax=Streptomyces TaxID=1883 RepID=UPI0029AA9905|nr:hypothetical protein [Streptomyces sp. ME02-6991-2A]MDX3376622.1 hypothetical protein [Streptomyces sp. ME02-6991-2A]